MATFGYTGASSASSPSSTNKTAVNQASPSQNGIASTATANLSMTAGSTTVSFCIYADSAGAPGALLAQSDPVTVSATVETAVAFTFTGANKIQLVAGTNYWIGPAWQDPGTPSINIFRGTGGSRDEVSAYAPNPFGTPTTGLAGPLVAYVTYDTATPVPATDSAPTSDTATVTRTTYTPLTEAAPTSEAVTGLRATSSLVEQASTAESTSIQVLAPVWISDSADSADTVLVANFDARPLTDSAPSTDTITITRITYVSLTDSGVGDDARSLQQTRNLTEAAPSSDVGSLGGQPYLTEAAATSELLRVVDIPFTAILPLHQGTLYELVVVARIPQIAGPPSFLEVDAIEWKDLSYANTLSQPQDLEASCQISSVPDSVLSRLRRPHEYATEMWVYRNGKLVFAGPLVGWRTSGESLTISAKGILSYLRLMIVERDLTFVQQDQFTFVKTMVDNWQGLEFGNFGIDTAGVGASGVLRDGTYYKKELHNVGQRIEELGQRIDGFDAEVNPASRRLELWYPTKGVDRSTGEDAIVVDARNIASSDTLCSVAIGDLASQGYGTGTASGADAALWSEQANDDLRTKYGRTAVTATWSDVSDQTTLDAHTRGLIDARKEALIVPGPNVRVTPDADLDDYGVGDTITYDLASQLGVSGPFRIRRQAIKVSSTGKETVDLEFV